MKTNLISLFMLSILVVCIINCDPVPRILKPVPLERENVEIVNNEIKIKKNDILIRISSSSINPGYKLWALFKIEIVNQRKTPIFIDPSNFELQIHGGSKKIRSVPPKGDTPKVASEFERFMAVKLSPNQTVNGFVFFVDLSYSFYYKPLVLWLNKIKDEITNEEFNFRVMFE